MCIAAAALVAPIATSTAWAQSRSGGREVVQALPPEGLEDLNRALAQLARNSRNVSALIDAGNASLKLGDIDAAIGFFGRADDLSPGNARVKVGLAGAFVRSERPLEALRLFYEAEQAGASTAQLAAERGLAYDLVGDNARAQEQYRTAMARRSNDEALRRMALSMAIAGDKDGFESALLPMLQRKDRAAFRARAFGLAILGEQQEAEDIIEAIMPREMARGIAPYLGYMPRLTKAQQAAAANLGIFPRAAQIGRDDPRIAQYASSADPVARTADARLAPSGRPLGAPPAEAKAEPAVAAAAPKADNPPQRPDARQSRAARREATDPMTRTRAPRRVAQQSVAAPAPAIAQTPTPGPSPVRVATTSGELPAVLGGATEATATVPVSAPGFDLARVGADAPPEAASVARPAAELVAEAAPQAIPTSAPQPAPAQASVADAFAGFTLAPTRNAPAAANAVDITSITPPREKPPEPKVAEKPAEPKHPKRFWVQIATGQNRAALKFDWRRFARQAPDVLGDLKPHVADWNATNRLLAGPFKTSGAARIALNALTEEGVDGFQYTSPEGQEVTLLP